MLCAAISAALATVVLVRLIDRTDIDWHKTSESWAHFATLVGVIVAGSWAGYIAWRKRVLVGRAEIVHRHQVWHDENGTVLRVFIVLHNPSESMLTPGDGMTYVQTPPTGPVLSNDYAYEHWVTIAKFRHPLTYEEVHIDPKEKEIWTSQLFVDARN
jgi:hypothetical protein